VETFAGLILFLICLFVYFLPSIVAIARKRDNNGAIFALNILLGWSFVGWVISFVWAVSNDD
jgi:hypothetical protein